MASGCFWRCNWLVLALTLCVSGCATYADQRARVQALFISGDLTKAQEAIDKGAERRFDRDVFQLDRAMVQLAEGKPREAEQNLREIRDRFDQLSQPAVGEKALSMLTDAQREAYHGEDYEQVLIRVMLSLTNLVQDGSDAAAYALQVNEKQQQVIDAAKLPDGTNPKAGYQQVAFGPYLYGAMREATHANYDDVQRAATVVCSWNPEFPYGQQDLERAKHGRHSAPGNGVLYVIALAGVGPRKEEKIEFPSQVALLIGDQILSAIGDQTLPPTIAPIKVPRVVLTQHDVGSIGLAVNGQRLGRTATITDIGQMAVQQHEAVIDRIVAEAVVRRVVKKSVIYGTKKLTGVQKHSVEGFLLDMVGVAWEATESADTRCWGLLPDKIQVLRLELPAGEHQLTLESLTAGGYPLGRPTTHRVEIVNGANTYVLGNFPHGNLVGTLLTNHPAKQIELAQTPAR
ncbi:MAG: hypothetical protein JNM18_15885 [Planctomycetaceae bacterium]|nr:hypothetical protein [Planctomycetaceae bacterium]